jgi:hypothetical protein
LSRYSLWEMLVFLLNQVSRVKIDPQEFASHSATVSPPGRPQDQRIA